MPFLWKKHKQTKKFHSGAS